MANNPNSRAFNVPATIDQVPSPPSPAAPEPLETALGHLRSYFLGGNTVVRVGVIILIVGVGLLGKWAADHDLFPPEARLILATLIGDLQNKGILR